jgi:hypothetical protein
MVRALLFVLAIASGIFFYRLRCRKPFIYGCVEISVGIVVIYFTLYPVETNYLLLVAGEPGLAQTFLPRLVGILAGIYIIVRGLDNMSRALPSHWAPWWTRLF